MFWYLKMCGYIMLSSLIKDQDYIWKYMWPSHRILLRKRWGYYLCNQLNFNLNQLINDCFDSYVSYCSWQATSFLSDKRRRHEEFLWNHNISSISLWVSVETCIKSTSFMRHCINLFSFYLMYVPFSFSCTFPSYPSLSKLFNY